MNPHRHAAEPPQMRASDEPQQVKGKRRTPHPKEAKAKAEQAARSVMHPDSYDPEWRYYHGAWGG